MGNPMHTGRVSNPMVKAIALALVLHGLAMVTARHYLPRRPRVAHSTVAQKQAAVPMAIEFLAPPMREEEQVHVPIPTPIPRQLQTKTPRRTGDSAVSRPTTQRSPSAEQSTATNPIRPATGLGMRRQGASEQTGLALNTRLAPAQEPGQPQAGPRADLISTGPASISHDSSAWSPSGGGTMRANKEPFHAEIKSDGRIQFRDRPNVQIEGIRISEEYLVPVIAGRFDVTDAIMSSLGETLYPYRKRKLMDESREMRAGMARADHSHQLKKALKHYNQHLNWLWKQESLTVWERKQALFALWDECAEQGSVDVLATARSIRAKTLAFIRAKLPKGSPHSYTASQARALNKRRQSSENFSPY